MKRRILITTALMGIMFYGYVSNNAYAGDAQVAAGYLHTVGLKTDGTVVAVGRNGYGECDLSSWTNIKQVAAGTEYYTVGLKTDGTVVTAGYKSSWGECDVSSWTDIKQVSAGIYHTIGLKTDGTVVAAGNNDYGQCDVSSWTNITQVAAGRYYCTIGLKTDGTVVAVGNNDYGACEVSSWTNIKQVAIRNSHTVGLKTNGTVVAVGSNINSFGACEVSSWTNIKQVAAGISHTVGLKTDGTVVAVGGNSFGECDLSSWKDIKQVAAGDYYTVGLKTDGTVVAVGDNRDGQCDVASWSLSYDQPSLSTQAQIEAFVSRFYEIVLGRSAETEGLDYWTNSLMNKTRAGADVATGFIFSKEFTNQELDNTSYVNVLYSAFFNRQSDQGGHSYWLGRLNNGESRDKILNGFINSQEFSNLCQTYGILAVN